MPLVVGDGTSTADILSANRKLVSHEDLALATDRVFGRRGNMPLMIGSISFDNHNDSTQKSLSIGLIRVINMKYSSVTWILNGPNIMPNRVKDADMMVIQ